MKVFYVLFQSLEKQANIICTLTHCVATHCCVNLQEKSEIIKNGNIMTTCGTRVRSCHEQSFVYSYPSEKKSYGKNIFICFFLEVLKRKTKQLDAFER